ncbi:nonsense-mediated mRNA decay factor SMG8-like isoform X2 [Lineus longissimus]|uniref:nonsense-mediated mRNA decay factor SMG8-like isoform X2 n=1 Tax=Lineus longissimus TaxID=88925 RepID=UPI00315D250D
MAATLSEIFLLPVSEEFIKDKDEKVCVVSIVGKSALSYSRCKASMLNPIFNMDMFGNTSQDTNGNRSEDHSQFLIEGYYDSQKRVVYLHMISPYDTFTLAELCKKVEKDVEDQGFHKAWYEQDHKYAKALLFIFSVSHIILLSQPGSSFDISYVRLFRTLDTIRVKLQPSITDQLKVFPISKEWMIAGRPCSPRVLFIFENHSLELAASNGGAGDGVDLTRSKTMKSPAIAIKKLQHAVEDQIYRILRKSRVITNISNNSLFAVPANEEFVYIHSSKPEIDDHVNFYLNHLRNMCQSSKETEGPRIHSYQTTRRSLQGSLSIDSNRSTSSMKPSAEHGLKDFLWHHIDLAMTKGFDDNVGRNPVSALFELPTAETWFLISNKLHQFFLSDLKEGQARASFNTLKSLLEIDTRFSESRCHKVLSPAEGAYQEGLPQYYPQSYHLNKLAQARHVFLQNARGPACDKYLVQLDEACERIWKNGRRQCEAISLTGNPCLNELHKLLEADPDDNIPVMAHSSKIKMKSFCNCGRKQAERDDPFDHRAANYEFYENFEQTCCNKLDHVELPIFKPSTSEVKAGRVQLARDTTKSPVSRKDSTKLDVTAHMSNLSLALSLGQSGGSDLYGHHGGQSGRSDKSAAEVPLAEARQSSSDPDHEEEAENEADAEADVEVENESEADVEAEIENEAAVEEAEVEENAEPAVFDDEPLADISTFSERQPFRQISTTEYHPGMIHTMSPPGLLPKFPSWSLVTIGRYTSYSHAQGLDQSGFLHGTNFLLPWDIHLKVDKERWPAVSESSKKSKGKKGHKESGEVSLKVFVGLEYECPRGHRFFMSTPDKVIKSNSGSSLKSANKLLGSDMPLYFSCQCSSKGYMGQLMRVFVAAPEGPMQVTLNPQVRPNPPPCPVFYPGNDQPIKLPQGMVSVLRLPYVYMGENGPCVIPNDPRQLAECMIMKGLFSYLEINQK